MGKIQIIFFNSATLLNPKTKELSENTIESLNRIKNRGIKICVTTRSADLNITPLSKADLDAYITFDGDFCYVKEELLFVQKHTEKNNKEIAVNMILDYFHLQKDEAIAFGIENNDIALFSAVGYGIAMKNASKRLKNVANEICETAAADGVYHFLSEQFII